MPFLRVHPECLAPWSGEGSSLLPVLTIQHRAGLTEAKLLHVSFLQPLLPAVLLCTSLNIQSHRLLFVCLFPSKSFCNRRFGEGRLCCELAQPHKSSFFQLLCTLASLIEQPQSQANVLAIAGGSNWQSGDFLETIGISFFRWPWECVTLLSLLCPAAPGQKRGKKGEK